MAEGRGSVRKKRTARLCKVMSKLCLCRGHNELKKYLKVNSTVNCPAKWTRTIEWTVKGRTDSKMRNVFVQLYFWADPE